MSVVIPVADGNEPVNALIEQLQRVRLDSDIVLAGPSQAASSLSAESDVRFVIEENGRGAAMNAAAREACNDWIWFLHADSRLSGECFDALEAAMADPASLWYFNLGFHDGAASMGLNALGVRLRSHWLGCPFGDQGFFIRRKLFLSMGGYPQELAYGEDHVFTWQCRRAGVRLRCCNAMLSTSARRYQRSGWLVTTVKHLTLWARQAWQQWRLA